MSLFSGVGGLCSLGLGAAGHDVVGLCEIDAKARSVLRRHHPDVPTWEDVTTLDGKSLHGRVDIVAGGSPCQDLSVAGRRAGLDGARSGLFWHQCRIAAETGARWVLWENVAGALSSNDGEDFAVVLWGLTGCRPTVPEDRWNTVGVCVGPERTAVWRLLDARWFGVAQRRRRVFVVAGPRSECGPSVLLEPESCGGDTRTRPTPGAHVAALTGNGVGTCGPDDNQAQAGHLIGCSSVTGAPLDVALSLDTRAEDGSRRNQDAPIILPISFAWMAGIGNVTDPVGGPCHTLIKSQHPAVAITMRGRDGHPEVEMGEPEIYNSLRAGDGGSSRQNALLTPDLAVRRLTPRECERLMGWPDDHTRWADDGSEIADSHRYRSDHRVHVFPLLKAAIDGCVDAGVWSDDTPEFVTTVEPYLFVQRPTLGEAPTIELALFRTPPAPILEEPQNHARTDQR
jgi:DNA (cytosine-5)-methyltransferase 1